MSDDKPAHVKMLKRNGNMTSMLKVNSGEQEDTPLEKRRRDSLNSKKLTTAAEDVYKHIACINREFIELARILASLENEDVSEKYALSMYGSVSEETKKAVDMLLQIGCKLKNCDNYTVMKLATFSKLMILPCGETSAFLLGLTDTALRELPFEPDRRLTVLYKWMFYSSKVSK